MVTLFACYAGIWLILKIWYYATVYRSSCKGLRFTKEKLPIASSLSNLI
jgi:hypothetical protein